MTPQNKAEIVALIEQHQALLYKVVTGYCTDVDEQEDLMQEIVFQLIKSYSNFDQKVKVTTWMYRVALNVAISYYRKLESRTKQFVPLNEKLVHIEENSTQEQNENLRQLKTFIQELPPLNRALLIMYLDGNTHSEIAEAMGISVSNVGTKISRIKNQLKKKFNQD